MPKQRTKRRHVYQDDIFAIYQGDEVVFIGTRNECAKELDVARTTITYYASPSHHARIHKRTRTNARLAIRLGRWSH